MNTWRFLAGMPRRRAAELRRALRGWPLTAPPLGSATLDADDARLARRLLNHRAEWRAPEQTADYQEAFARWNGSRHAFAFMGGRVALSACIHALGLGPGDEVIVPGYTCIVVPNAFDYAGVRVVYCDIELDTYGPDVNSVRERITPRTRAILLQHLYGLVCRDYDALLDLARSHGLRTIEDCAHATGAEYQGRKVGTAGDVAFYSSEQSKVFCTIQGGMAVTNDDALADRLRAFHDAAPEPDDGWIERQLTNVLLNYARFKHPLRWLLADVAEARYGPMRLISTTAEEERGQRPAHYGRRMPAAVCALGRNQLDKIDRYNAQRRETARRWDAWCDDTGYSRPVVIPGSTPVYLRYPVLVEPEKKRSTEWALKTLKVAPGEWFKTNLHPVERAVPGCPNADSAVARCINLPTLLS